MTVKQEDMDFVVKYLTSDGVEFKVKEYTPTGIAIELGKYVRVELNKSDIESIIYILNEQLRVFEERT